MREELPKVRQDLQIMTTQLKNQRVAVVRDFIGLIREPIVLNQELMLLLSLLYQCRTMEELQTNFVRYMGGVLVTRDQIIRLLNLLDSYLLLETERYQEQYSEMVREFEASSIRPPACNGRSYPDDPQKLEGFIKEILSLKEKSYPGRSPLAIVAPHIELQVGMQAYASAYNSLQAQRYETVIILGVGHSLNQGLLNIADKDFLTPLGVVRCHGEMVSRLRKAAGEVQAPDQLAHKGEHSIEFQLLFLQYLLGNDHFHLVPILVGSFHQYLANVGRAGEIAPLRPFITELREIIHEQRGKVLLVAGVDFAHTGRKFGDRYSARAIHTEAEAHDRRLLEFLRKQEPENFWGEVQRVEDRYHICGFSTLALLLEVLPGCSGEILHYETWFEDSTASAVSFAALHFYQR